MAENERFFKNLFWSVRYSLFSSFCLKVGIEYMTIKTGTDNWLLKTLLAAPLKNTSGPLAGQFAFQLRTVNWFNY